MSNQLIDPFVETEKRAQPLLDMVYGKNGFTVNRQRACKEFDVEITKDGKTFKVEEKIRGEDHADILVELVQDIVSGNPGWYSRTGCDLLVYAVVIDGKLLKTSTIRWSNFKTWLAKYIPENQRRLNHKYSIRGYGVTLNVVIPLKEIPSEYIKVNHPVY